MPGIPPIPQISELFPGSLSVLIPHSNPPVSGPSLFESTSWFLLGSPNYPWEQNFKYSRRDHSSAEAEFAHEVQCFLVSVRTPDHLLSLTGHQLNGFQLQERKTGGGKSCNSFVKGVNRENRTGFEKPFPIRTGPKPGKEEKKERGKKLCFPIEDSKVKISWNKNLLKFYL